MCPLTWAGFPAVLLLWGGAVLSEVVGLTDARLLQQAGCTLRTRTSSAFHSFHRFLLICRLSFICCLAAHRVCVLFMDLFGCSALFDVILSER